MNGDVVDEVLALVVTHSSAATLTACIAALRAQTRPPEHILVIDNAGCPPASRTLAEAGPVVPDADIEIRRLDVNTGPAGGYAEGLARFLEREVRWVWAMDDDVLPEPDCLDRLVAATRGDDGPRIVWPRIREVSGSPHDYPGWCGVLLDREVVATVGFPIADLVWWAEDTEYLQRRIPRAGFRPSWVEDARVVHTNARDETTMPPWKVYYQVRNTVYYRWHVQGLTHPVRLTRSLIRTLGAALVPPGPRALRVRRYVAGLYDGARGRLGLRVQLP